MATGSNRLVRWVQKGARPLKNRPVDLLPMEKRRLAARRNADPSFDRACSLHAEGRHLEVPLEFLAGLVRAGRV